MVKLGGGFEKTDHLDCEVSLKEKIFRDAVLHRSEDAQLQSHRFSFLP